MGKGFLEEEHERKRRDEDSRKSEWFIEPHSWAGLELMADVE